MPKQQQYYKIEIETRAKISIISLNVEIADTLVATIKEHSITTHIPEMITEALDLVNHLVLREIHDQMRSHERKNPVDSGFDVPDGAPDRVPPHLQHPPEAPEVLF